jgi:hypothetical protein
MRKLKINSAPANPEGGYISRTISNWMLSSAPIIAWTQFYHKPFSLDDWEEARAKAKERCTNNSMALESIIRRA